VVPVPQVNNPEYLWAISSHDGSVWAVGWQGPEPNDLIFKWTR
jgi:hypothetical protein